MGRHTLVKRTYNGPSGTATYNDTWEEIMHDPINHPKHYTQGIECIDYIESHKMNYMEGNIIKYVTRYKDKGGVEDLRKAEWYLKHLIQSIVFPLAGSAEFPTITINPVSHHCTPVEGPCCDHPDTGICGSLPMDDWSNSNIPLTLSDVLDLEKEKREEIVRETAEAIEESKRNYAEDPYLLGDYHRFAPNSKPWINE